MSTVRTWFWLVALVVFATFEVSALADVRVLGATPDLGFALVAVWALTRDQRQALAMAVPLGLVPGLLGAQPLGASLAAIAPVVAFANVRELGWLRGEFPVDLLVTGAAAACYPPIQATMWTLAGQGAGMWSAVAGTLPGFVLAEVALAALLYWPVHAMGRRAHAAPARLR